MSLTSVFLTAIAAVGAFAAPAPDAEGKYTLTAPGIKAKFIPYGATLTELWVKDKNGVDVDIVLGYDDADYYPIDPGHPVYNAIPGRYASRIGNATYSINGTKYMTEKNDGPNTLHSGTNNWSYRFWNVTSATNSSITFTLLDESNSSKGMMGRVAASVTYSLEANKWNIHITADSLDQPTPIMVTQHTYFNLDHYANPSTPTIWNHTLHLPHSGRYLVADKNALPTGQIANVVNGTIDDFYTQPRQLGFASGWSNFEDHCGGGCHGYNGEWVQDATAPANAVVAKLSSAFSGISAELRSNQAGLVIYTCNWSDGKAILKKSQGIAGQNRTVTRDSCVAIEAHDWADGINHPEWNRTSNQIFGPGQKYDWQSSWTFGTM